MSATIHFDILERCVNRQPSKEARWSSRLIQRKKREVLTSLYNECMTAFLVGELELELAALPDEGVPALGNINQVKP